MVEHAVYDEVVLHSFCCLANLFVWLDASAKM